MTGTAAGAADLTLRMPAALIEAGFDKQILPRFRFRHRIDVAPVAEGEADMALGPGGEGTRVFSDAEGGDYRLTILTPDAARRDMAATFLAWLTSDPGKSAIEAFAPDGTALFTTETAKVETVEEESFDGDHEAGAALALRHCGRCHVVDHRNRMGGIGSTPSFAAMRGRPNWSELFRAFYTENPHPSFTQVAGVTEPFDPARDIHVAPVEITLDDVEAITAFVATLEAKDLGRPVQSN